MSENFNYSYVFFSRWNVNTIITSQNVANPAEKS